MKGLGGNAVNITLLNGSPHTNGETASLLFRAKKILETYQDVEVRIIHTANVLSKLKKPYCIVCSNPCSGKCYHGTLMEECVEILRKSDGIIIGSPVYFGTLSSQLKSFWDLTRVIRKERGLYNTVGFALAVGASRFGGQETTVKAILDIMLIHDMIVIGSGYIEAPGQQGVCGQKPVDHDEFAQMKIEAAARRLYEVCKGTEKLRSR